MYPRELRELVWQEAEKDGHLTLRKLWVPEDPLMCTEKPLVLPYIGMGGRGSSPQKRMISLSVTRISLVPVQIDQGLVPRLFHKWPCLRNPFDAIACPRTNYDPRADIDRNAKWRYSS